MTQPIHPGSTRNPIRPSRYHDLLPPAPICGPADHLTALDYLHAIERVIVHGGWSAFETKRLHQLKRKWRRRAEGKDPRFNLVGNKDGRLPAETEYTLRPRMRRARLQERAQTIPPQDQRPGRSGWWGHKTVDADLPTTRAKGYGADLDPDYNAFEPETGEIALPKVDANQYIIPGQDIKGHAQRVWCRVQPAHYRALCAIERSKKFGFRTIGDVIRWCIDYGMRELQRRDRIPQVASCLAQFDAIRELIIQEQQYLEWPDTFTKLSEGVNRHLNDNAMGQAVRLIGLIRSHIESMPEDYWREKYMKEFMDRFGKYIEDVQGGAVNFGED